MVIPLPEVSAFEVKRSAPSVFRVYKHGALVAVVREPLPLTDDPAHRESCRVDCREESDDLMTFLAGYFSGQTLEYVENSTWTWTHNEPA